MVVSSDSEVEQIQCSKKDVKRVLALSHALRMHRIFCEMMETQYDHLLEAAEAACNAGLITERARRFAKRVNRAANAARHEGFWSENEPADEPSEMTPADEPAAEVEPADEPVGYGPAPSSFSLATQAYTIESSC